MRSRDELQRKWSKKAAALLAERRKITGRDLSFVCRSACVFCLILCDLLHSSCIYLTAMEESGS